ncbi:MAG: HAMP domain-containing histidine kinase, partial [Flavisolibacter sp.]|nr:HAMP domain-containing histidine kinase [Flavisolibacter sp.]
AGLVLINRNLTRQIWNPFYQTLQKLRTYKIEQEESIRLERSEIDEFNDLNQTIEDLAQRNRQVYQSQKEFTENAAHEMQTPLAVLQSKLELLMQTEPLTGEQAALITTLAETNSRLSRLNKSLLLLTKIENNQYPETEELDVAEVCRKVIAQVSDEADVQGIKIETNFEESVKVTANRTLFEILVSNLLSNAIRYNHTDGIVKVTCNHQQLRVQNTGSDIKLDAEKIFDRFHKEGIHSQSIGLGLAIVKRIAALYHFTISYTFENNLHTFTVGLLV